MASRLKPSGTFATSSGEASYYDDSDLRITIINKNDYKLDGWDDYTDRGGYSMNLTGNVAKFIKGRYSEIYRANGCIVPKQLYIKLTSGTHIFLDHTRMSFDAFKKY